MKACTIVAGVSRSGKTSFGARYLVAERDFNCRFIFDAESAEDAPDEGEFSHRLGLTPAEDFHECAAAVEDGFVVFDPHALYPGRMVEAFSDFCAWSFEAAKRLPGRKVILLDEAWKYCSPHAIPLSLATVVQTGQKRGLETLFTTQRPNKLNEAILNEWTELVCFTLDGEKALDCVEDKGAVREEVRQLPLGSFVALNRHTRGVLRGRLF